MCFLICSLLIHGANWPLLSRLAYGLLLLMLLLLGFGIASLIRAMRKATAKRKSDTTIPLSSLMTMPAGRPTDKPGWNKPALMLAIGLGIGGIAGYAIRNQQLLSNTQTLADVLVLKKMNDSNYRLQTDKGQAFNATFCADSHVDFQPGQKMKVLNYEQRTGCKSVVGKNLGFLFYTDAQGERVTFPREVTLAGY